jgi:hypothetical protein
MGECSMCDKQSVVIINNAAACPDHIDEVMRLGFCGVAVLNGIDPDDVESKIGHLVDQAKAHVRDHHKSD